MRRAHALGVGLAVLGTVWCPCVFRSVSRALVANHGASAAPLATASPPSAATSTLPALASDDPAVFASTSGPPQKPDNESDYLRELSRLHTVDKSRALAFARQGDIWYSSTGALAEARHAMVVTLLVDLGDMSSARQVTRALIAASPRSPYLPLVEGVTGIHPRPHGPSFVQ